MRDEPSDLLAQAVVQAFVNQTGGPLLHQLSREMAAIDAGEIVECPVEHFQATELVFTQNGETTAIHLQWRQTKMRRMCEHILIQLRNEQNPLQTSEEAQTNNKGQTTCKNPGITRKQLEVEAAKQFIQERKTQLQAAAKKKKLRTNAAALQTEEKDEYTQQQRKGNLPDPTWDDLIGNMLSAEQVVDWYLRCFPDKAEGDDPKGKMLASFSQAVCRAAKRHKVGKPDKPIRVSRRRDSTWPMVAVVEKGKGGPNGGNKYRLIGTELDDEAKPLPYA